MGLHLPRSATRIKLCSRCHDTHAGVHLRIVFALGDAHIDMRMRMSCARGDGARPITESGKSACGSSTARSSSVSGVPSTLGLSAATYGAPTVTRVPLAPVFFFVGCPTVPVALVFFFAACPAVRSLLCPSRFGSYHETAETAIVGLFGLFGRTFRTFRTDFSDFHAKSAKCTVALAWAMGRLKRWPLATQCWRWHVRVVFPPLSASQVAS